MDKTDKKLGLNDQQVSESRGKYGDNNITPKEKESLWKLFFEKFNDPMIRILLIAAVLSLGISILHNEYAETIGIFFAIFLATGIAFWFEKDAQKKFDVLNKVSDLVAIKVIRNGVVVEVAKSDIVVGDIVIFEAGEELPADGELLESNALLINESSLTGELSISKTVKKTEFELEATYPSNWVYRSTTVLEGSGIMRVEYVGDSTEYGKVAEQSVQKHDELTPLAKQLESLAKLVGICGFSLAMMVFTILLFKDIFFMGHSYSDVQILTLFVAFKSLMLVIMKVWMPIVIDLFGFLKIKVPILDKIASWSWVKNFIIALLFFVVVSGLFYLGGVNFFTPDSWIGLEEAGRVLQHFMVAVTLIVVSIPEGLPMSVTLSLALSMRRMLKTNNLVRKMHACETMGATTVICTDKTGTLTQNQMKVHKAFFDNKQDFSDNSEYSNLVAYSVAMNTTAFLDETDPANIKCIGNPTEAALLLWCKDVNIDYLNIRVNTQRVDRLAFSTERKFMATIISMADGRKVLLVKGAPEVILAKCIKQFSNDGVVPFGNQESVKSQLMEMQNKAMRTLAFAYVELDSEVNSVEGLVVGDLTYLGFVAIADPIREEVVGAIKNCLKASIEVKIVTGDTSATAIEIARQIGLWSDSDTGENIITGVEFEALTEEEAYERVDRIKIMCRARPADKQRLVGLLQKRGEVVAVTGDGTNDAPALNRAHVGLSMGTGTAIAKEASDITLLDDSFASIVSAVVWGRSLYLNIQRFIVFQLTVNLTAMVVVLVGSILGKELFLTVTQMLWVNLIMDTFAAGALAALPPSMKLLSRAPRKNSAFIVTPAMASNIFIVGGAFVAALMVYMYYMYTGEGVNTYALTMFFTTFVLLHFWNMFNAKAYDTATSAFSSMKQSKSFIFISILILAGQYLIVTYGGKVFRTVPLEWIDWLKIFVATSSVLWFGEIVRLVKRAINKS